MLPVQFCNAADGDAESGPWKVTLDGPSYISAMQHLGVRGHREKVRMCARYGTAMYNSDASIHGNPATNPFLTS